MKPILFNTEMVRAILDGRKTQTRRLIKQSVVDKILTDEKGNCVGSYGVFDTDAYPTVDDAPYQPGDILYVRETWAKDPTRYIYRANYSGDEVWYQGGKEIKMKWHPSIHMPKEAARIFLKVTNVRVERLQEIKADECVAEGAVRKPNITKRGDLVIHKRYQKEFADLWDSTVQYPYEARCGWDANPWVWVYEFERVEG